MQDFVHQPYKPSLHPDDLMKASKGSGSRHAKLTLKLFAGALCGLKRPKKGSYKVLQGLLCGFCKGSITVRQWVAKRSQGSRSLFFYVCLGLHEAVKVLRGCVFFPLLVQSLHTD